MTTCIISFFIFQFRRYQSCLQFKKVAFLSITMPRPKTIKNLRLKILMEQQKKHAIEKLNKMEELETEI